MKKIIILAVALIAAFTAAAQVKSSDYKYSSFNGISIDDNFVVKVSSGKNYKITVEAESAFQQYITVGVSAGVLEISLDERAVPSEVKKLFKGKSPVFKAKVVTPEPLKTYKLEGKSVLTVEDEVAIKDTVSIFVGDNAVLKPMTIVADGCEIVLQKKGSAEVTFNGDKVSVDASGSSELNLTRETDKTDVALSGSSSLVMRGSTSSLRISSKGTSKAAVNGSAEKAEFTMGGTSNINAVGMELNDADVDMSGLCTLTEAAKENLAIDISGGASLVFDAKPVIEIKKIKNASVTHYNK